MEQLKYKQFVFKRWSNKKWSILASFHKIIIIATLCFSYNILGQVKPAGGNDSTEVSIHLELDEVESLGDAPFELESTSLKFLSTVNVRDIVTAPVTSPDDLLDYLHQVDIRHRGKFGTQADLNILGGTFDQSMVLLNGINLSDPQTGHFHLNLPMDLSAIHHLEVVSGSAARRFGTQAFSGAINFATDPRDSTGFNSGFRFGQHNFYKAYLNANVSGKYLSSLTSISTSGSDGYRNNTDFKSSHFYFHAVTRPANLNAQVMLGLNTREFGANAFYSPLFEYQYEETSTGLIALKLNLNRPHSVYTLNAYLRLNKDYFLLDRYNPDFYRNDHLTAVAGADLNGRFSSRAGVTHSALGYRRESILSTSLGEPLETGNTTIGSGDILFSNGHERNQLNWNINHTLESGLISMDGGFLIHINSDLGAKPYVLPGLDIRFQFPYNIRIFTSLNRSMRLPTFTDLYYQGPTNHGNPDLVPERATTFELGVFRRGDVLLAVVNGFYRQGRNLIDWIWMEDDKWHTLNLTEIDALGGDFNLKYNPGNEGSPHLSLEKFIFSYTFTHLTRISDQVISRYLLDNLRHKIVMGADVNLTRNLLLDVRFNFQDRNGSFLKYNSESGQSLEQSYEPFLKLDAKLIYSFRRFHLFLESTNLLNMDYYDIGNVIQPGRWSMLGIEFR